MKREINTRSLTSTWVTLFPTSRTSPLHSKPGTNGGRGVSSNRPYRLKTSLKFTPLKRERKRQTRERTLIFCCEHANRAILPGFHRNQNFPICWSRWLRNGGHFQFSPAGKCLLNDNTFHVSGRCCSCEILWSFISCHRVNNDQRAGDVFLIRSGCIDSQSRHTAFVVFTLVSSFTICSCSFCLSACSYLASSIRCYSFPSLCVWAFLFIQHCHNSFLRFFFSFLTVMFMENTIPNRSSRQQRRRSRSSSFLLYLSWKYRDTRENSRLRSRNGNELLLVRRRWFDVRRAALATERDSPSNMFIVVVIRRSSLFFSSPASLRCDEENNSELFMHIEFRRDQDHHHSRRGGPKNNRIRSSS